MRRKDFLRMTAAMVCATAAVALTGCGGGGSDAVAAVDATSAAAAPAALVATETEATAAVTSLSEAEVAAVRFMREEEKLAHDVYATLHATWGLKVFANIALSETDHTEAILGLLVKYDLDDPAEGRAAGEFEDPELQALHDTLVAAGSLSAIEGLKVGALIEETDIRDINEKKAITDNPDILGVYDSLLCGSGNHLRAFNTQLLANGVTYEPQVISQAEWDAIASAEATTCG